MKSIRRMSFALLAGFCLLAASWSVETLHSPHYEGHLHQGVDLRNSQTRLMARKSALVSRVGTVLLAANCHQECTPRTKEVCEPVEACQAGKCFTAQQCHKESDGEDCQQVCDPDPQQG